SVSGCLLCVFPFIRCSGRRFFRVPVRRHAAGGWLHRAVLCAARDSAGTGRVTSALTREFVSSSVGVVPDLFRIGGREAGERRSRMAAPYRDGRVLPERATPHLDRMVRTAPAAPLPCFHSRCNPGVGVGISVDDVHATPLADYLLLHCDHLADRRYFERQLYILELSRAGARVPA